MLVGYLSQVRFDPVSPGGVAHLVRRINNTNVRNFIHRANFLLLFFELYLSTLLHFGTTFVMAEIPDSQPQPPPRAKDLSISVLNFLVLNSLAWSN